MQMLFKNYNHFLIEEGTQILFEVTYDYDKKSTDLNCQITSGRETRTVVFKRVSSRLFGSAKAKYRIESNGSTTGKVAFTREGGAYLEFLDQPNVMFTAGKTSVHNHVYIGEENKDPIISIYKLASHINGAGTHEIMVKKPELAQNFPLLSVYGALLNYLSDELKAK